MSVMTATPRHLGRWTYDPPSNELRSAGETVRIEERAARVLDMLSERPGEVVSRASLVEQVWDGRQVSDNSVPMVMGQLRRALGEDARSPRIETIPKRGYRLVLPEPMAAADASRGPVLAFGLVVALLAILLFALVGGPASRETIVVLRVGDETGDPAYAALTTATDALLVSRVVERGFKVSRQASPVQEVLRARLVLWEGRPFLAIEALKAGQVGWSAMIDGKDGGIPAGLGPELDAWVESRAD